MISGDNLLSLRRNSFPNLSKVKNSTIEVATSLSKLMNYLLFLFVLSI